MSQAASQAWAFYREVAKKQVVWTIRDADGFPAPINSSGQRAQPFWSSRRRVEKIIATVPTYRGFEPYEMTWADFCEKCLPELAANGYLVGVNWSGSLARGYDLEPEFVRKAVQAFIEDAGS
jgi:hypothetical protein